MGLIEIDVTAMDDRAGSAVGFELQAIGGAPPASFDSGPVRESLNDTLMLYFNPDHGSFTFDLQIRAIDLNGNLGPPTVITIEDTVEGSGSRATGSAGASAGLALGVLGLVLRRRRPRVKNGTVAAS